MLLFLETRRCVSCFQHKNLVEMENNNFESFFVVFLFDVFTILICDERSDFFLEFYPLTSTFIQGSVQ